MVKKIIWMVMLLLITAGTVFFGEGFKLPFGENETTTTPEVCTNCETITAEPVIETAIVTEIVEVTEVTEIATEVTEIVEETEIVTVTEEPATSTPTVTATSVNELFSIQTGNPTYLVNFAHADSGCNWEGLAGQVFDKSGDPIMNYIVKVTGTYNNATITALGVTGLVKDDPYGVGNYEVVLGNKAVDSEDQLFVQLYDSKGIAVTNKISIDTYSSCENNLILLNFVEK